MPPDIYSERDNALRLLCETLVLAAGAPGTVAYVRLVAWIHARDERDGGFLWLAAVLGYPPRMLGDMLQATLDAPPRRRHAIARRLHAYAEAG